MATELASAVEKEAMVEVALAKKVAKVAAEGVERVKVAEGVEVTSAAVVKRWERLR